MFPTKYTLFFMTWVIVQQTLARSFYALMSLYCSAFLQSQGTVPALHTVSSFLGAESAQQVSRGLKAQVVPETRIT